MSCLGLVFSPLSLDITYDSILWLTGNAMNNTFQKHFHSTDSFPTFQYCKHKHPVAKSFDPSLIFHLG